MSNMLVVGVQWGDEGKGKIIDVIAREADIVARFQGGPNAGHTVVYDGKKFILHMVPSGILHEGKQCLIGNGMVIDAAGLLAEIGELEGKGVSVKGRLFVSSHAHLIMPYHKAIDAEKERALGNKEIGTTKRGIGPAYADKASRTGLRICDLLDRHLFREKLQANLREKNALLGTLYGASPFDEDDMLAQFDAFREKLSPYAADTNDMLKKAVRQSRRILFEGAQGALLDIDHGTYPYVTSSSTTVGGVCSGLGVPPKMIGTVLGVVKAYTTRVGSGPFPTEMHGETGNRIRQDGSEFGSTTGRPRRCGWLDFVALRHSVWINGVDGLALTRLDVLDHIEELQVCTAYRLDGRMITDTFPRAELLERCEPVYETIPGWATKTQGINTYEALPSKAKKYIQLISDVLGVPVIIVSTGESRDSTIISRPLFT